MTHRRDFLLAGVAAGFAAGNPKFVTASQPANDYNDELPVRFALNMSTIKGQNLSIEKQIDVAAAAGYDGIEPWMRDIEKYVAGGGSLDKLADRISQSGLTVDSAIGFAKWISDDDAVRAEALKQARHDMELVKAIGGTRIAAPPSGISGKGADVPSLQMIADRYRALLEVGAEIGVVPQLELWGHAPVLSKLGELAYVATAASHPDACVLPDFFHIYKGGNDFAGLAMIEASRMHCFHINDYPANPPQDLIRDKDRVFPGDGVCPLPEIIRRLIDNGFRGTFSLELFNPEYWKRDGQEVATEGLQKSKSVVQQALQIREPN